MNLHLSYIPFFDTVRIIETGVFNIFVWNFHRLCNFLCFMWWQREFLEIMVYCEDFPIDHPEKSVIQICCSRTGSEHKILKKSLCQGILWHSVCRSHQTACIILSFCVNIFCIDFGSHSCNYYHSRVKIFQICKKIKILWLLYYNKDN